MCILRNLYTLAGLIKVSDQIKSSIIINMRSIIAVAALAVAVYADEHTTNFADSLKTREAYNSFQKEVDQHILGSGTLR
jgi:hypothetical protein